jgi:hypothetical protein
MPSLWCERVHSQVREDASLVAQHALVVHDETDLHGLVVVNLVAEHTTTDHG